MSDPVLSPSMTLAQVAEFLEQHKCRDLDVYVRIESVKGKPLAYLIREPTSRTWIPHYLRQAE